MESICPLLQDPANYIPDTIDLINNVEERDYWLPCLEKMVKKFTDKASVLNPDEPNATEKAENCFHIFHNLVEKLKEDPHLIKPLSIRTLLEFNEQTLRDNNFYDAWMIQKEKETTAAFLEFSKRIDYIDSIDDFDVKWFELSKGVLAGNMFDWGATAVTEILETSSNFGLLEAMDRIEKRPWFRDDLDSWIDNIKKKTYKNIVIFVDNAGVDFVLGIIPLTRELLKQKSRVILSANTFPALNDITISELNSCLCKAAQYCPVVDGALLNKQLISVENGQSGPCLDLSHLNADLCNMIRDVDLVILEGMGRAVHTNLHAKFKVDSLKLAVLKNERLARSLGGQQFSVIFEYQPASSP